MRNKKTWVILILASALLLPVYSANRPVPHLGNPEEMKKIQEQTRQEQGQMMEQMKQQDPSAYEQMKANQEREEKIAQITTDFRAGKISYDNAKAALRPFIEQAIKARADNVDADISQLEQRIVQLKKFKTTFREEIDETIDAYLGKTSSQPISLPGSGRMF